MTSWILIVFKFIERLHTDAKDLAFLFLPLLCFLLPPCTTVVCLYVSELPDIRGYSLFLFVSVEQMKEGTSEFHVLDQITNS